MFAHVAIPRSAPEPLTYAVPPALEAWVRSGVRVRVPVRNRTATGLVVATADTTDLDPAVVRELVEVVDEAPVLPPHLLELADFVAGYYRAPLGDTLAAMLPAALLRADAEEIECTEAGVRSDVELLPDAQRALLETLRDAGRLRVPTLLSRAGVATRGPLDRLLEARLVRGRRRRRDLPPSAEVPAVALPDRPVEELLEACSRAPKRREVVAWLAAEGRPALQREVAAGVGCSDGVIREMVKAGLLRRFTQPPPRRSPWTLGSHAARHELTGAQTAAVAAVDEAVTRRTFTPLLLDGVTGSGKTEVYLRGLETALALGRGGIVLVPEIGLTPAASGAVQRRFGERVAVLHSAQSDGERYREWGRVRSGEARVVIGPRSALFAPVDDLGLIVVDEEHDAAYKQQEAPRYNARDLALVLGQRLDVPVLLCSATPSVEASALVHRGLATRLELPERVAGGALPEVELVDLRAEPPDPGEQGHTLFSRRLLEVLGETLDAGHQAILLMQRRGWAPMLQCRDCGHTVECPECSVAMVVHRRSDDLRCHYCGHRRSLPETCPECAGDLMHPIGAGTEKVAAQFEQIFPDVPVAVLDRDSVRRRGGLEATLGAFASGRARVLVGTQMVAKGHHFPAVTLTGVISADAMLGLPDFRAAERTFQLLTQVAGRAGRGDRPGRVVIQTYYPEHPAVRFATRHDTTAFLEQELVYRQAFAYPPAARMAVVRFEGRSEQAVRRAAQAAGHALVPVPDRTRVRGPSAAPIERLRGNWRWQLLLSAPNRDLLRELLARVEHAEVTSGVRRVVDVDPLSTL